MKWTAGGDSRCRSRDLLQWKIKPVVSDGIGFGCALAAIISWSLYESVVWAIVHGVFSWGYVFYYVLTR